MKYLCYYDHNHDGHPKRSNPPAAATKLLYIAKCLSKIEPTEIISASGVLGTASDGARVEQLTDRLSVRYFFSLGRKNKLLGKLGTGLVRMQLMLYLLFCVSKNETIVAYHSLGYMKLLHAAKRIKGFRVILEVEEIYADVLGDSALRKKELHFMECADGYLFPTKLLSNLVNQSGKPEVIIHGTYRVEEDLKCNIFESDLQRQGKPIIHVVYAGTLDPRKGGAIAAAAAAEFLPENYHIHILGFGSEKEIQNMKDMIKNVAAHSKASVTYDGLLSGEDYIQFIQSCDIGLSTQDPDAAFNATSFPSKILSYMANGLRVVSIRIPAIEQSAVGDALFYYDRQASTEIAKAIQSVNMDPGYDSRTHIQDLDKEFCEQIGGLIK